MCGITGIVRRAGLRSTDAELLRRMTDAIAHRGPDGEGFFRNDRVGLGHRRLAIIDLHEGAQPLFNEDGSVVVVFNGEIYNFKELRSELESAGHTFKTHTDTEVIVHGWEQWGPDCVARFRGMFAFAVYDAAAGTVFIARDRLGIKPLYYRYDAALGQLLFASELKALEQDADLPRAIDPMAVEEYFAFGYIPDPRSIYTSVRKLRPGYTLTLSVTDGSLVEHQYWNLSDKRTSVSTFEDATAELLARLEEAVACRLVADVPLGAFLSGGVDSSAVVSLMAGLRDDPIRTTSIGFNETRYDETPYAEQVATRYGCAHSIERVTADDLFMIEALANLYDEPYADSSALPTFALCKATRKQVTVALSGDGGDELFAGYRGYRLHMNKERVRRLVPAPVRRLLFGGLGAVYPKYDWMPQVLRAKTTFQTLALDAVESYAWGSMVSTAADRNFLFSAGFQRDLQGYSAFEAARAVARSAPVSDPLRLAQYLDFKLYLPGDILTKVDRASMAHGLEVRVPILDHRFVEWGFGLPDEYKMRNGEGKYILKKMMEPRVDSSILYRKKQGFAIPVAEWLRGPLRPALDACARDGRALELDIFSQRGLRTLLDQFYSGARDHSALLWSVLLFEQFLRRGSRA